MLGVSPLLGIDQTNVVLVSESIQDSAALQLKKEKKNSKMDTGTSTTDKCLLQRCLKM